MVTISMSNSELKRAGYVNVGGMWVSEALLLTLGRRIKKSK